MNTAKDTQMQDTELYALLDSVMEDERLTVREDLIQATLQRVKEEEAGLIPVKKSGRKLYRILSYTGMAAAAAFVLFVGVKIVNNGGFSGNNMKAESVADSSYRNDGNWLTADSVQSESTGSKENGKKDWFYSVADDADGAEMQEPLEDAFDVVYPDVTEDEVPERGGTVQGCSKVKLSADLQETVSGTDNTEAVLWAECWMLRQRNGNWQEEMRKLLEACVIERDLPEEGAYDYALRCDDGVVKKIKAETLLDLVVRIETESGELWGFFGENVRVFKTE